MCQKKVTNKNDIFEGFRAVNKVLDLSTVYVMSTDSLGFYFPPTLE